MPLINVAGRAIYAEVHEATDPQAPAVLFLHGAGSNAATWWQQLPSFTQRWCCITMDLRCFGRSVAPMEEYTFKHLVGDAHAVLDYFNVEQAAVVGQSLGGMVGLRLALWHPQRVWAFASCDSPLAVDQPDIALALERRARTANALTLEQRSLGAWFLQRYPEKAALYRQINHFNPAAHSVPPDVWRQAMDRLIAPDQCLPMEALRALACPTLWLVGREDPLVPLPAMQQAASLAPRSELAVIDDCGHSTYFEKPEAFNHRVMDFLGRALGDRDRGRAIQLPTPASAR
jgi:3-oxoadipate enol-lactonase